MIATSPSKRWLMKAAERNPELSSKYRTNGATGRPRKKWEDDINEFLKLVEEETENLSESSSHGSTQQKTAEDGLYSKKIHNDFGRTTGKYCENEKEKK